MLSTAVSRARSDDNTEDRVVISVRKSKVSLYVDRSLQSWVVRDPDGNFWRLPSFENPWDHRQPFELTPDAVLEPVPAHYKDMLGVPF